MQIGITDVKFNLIDRIGWSEIKFSPFEEKSFCAVF